MSSVVTPLVGVVIAAGLAAILAALDGAPAEAWGRGWIGYTILLGLGIFSIRLSARLFSATPNAVRLAWIAAGLRLAMGVGLMLALPIYGYAESEVTRAGYFYFDTSVRDQMAWQVAAQNLSIMDAFKGIYPGDQYGGMLALSAVVYRLLSPDVHRPFLILILTAAAAGWGVLAVWAAVSLGSPYLGPRAIRLGEQGETSPHNKQALMFAAPGLAAAIFAFFPEGVVLGATHMREAFVIPALAVAFYGVVVYLRPDQQTAVPGSLAERFAPLMIFAGLTVTVFFQPPLALAGVIGLGGLYLAYEFDRRGIFDWRKILLIGLVGLVLIGVIASAWERMAFSDGQTPLAVLSDWLMFNLKREGGAVDSEQVRRLLGDLPLAVRSLVLSIFGLLQPLLPAAVFSTGNAFWRVAGGLRAAGWYLLAPILGYALWMSIRPGKSIHAMTVRWLMAWIWGWSWFSALRAGGDQWDNPRYRAVFLCMQALLAAWVLTRHYRAVGLRRILLVEGSMVLVFCVWYIGRYMIPLLYFDFITAVAGSVILSAAALAIDWVITKTDLETFKVNK